MFAAWFPASELFHLDGEPDFSSRAIEVGEFFKVVPHLHE